LENVVDLVITNGTTNTINSDMWMTSMIGDTNNKLSILDFGCGVGRNIFDFSQKFNNWKFYGYDNSNMLKKAGEYSIKKFDKNINQYPNIELFSEWDVLKSIKFDCVYATIVFQHIYEKDLNLYIQDIKKMTNRLIVSGRRFNDDIINDKHKNTWQILENNGLYPSNANEISYKIDGDPDEHITCIYDF
jgi:cyclopropane fatty-acyl-phospholipid synthase-like methyltransferase